jgi:hypothetical protein
MFNSSTEEIHRKDLVVMYRDKNFIAPYAVEVAFAGTKKEDLPLFTAGRIREEITKTFTDYASGDKPVVTGSDLDNLTNGMYAHMQSIGNKAAPTEDDRIRAIIMESVEKRLRNDNIEFSKIDKNKMVDTVVRGVSHEVLKVALNGTPQEKWSTVQNIDRWVGLVKVLPGKDGTGIVFETEPVFIASDDLKHMRKEIKDERLRDELRSYSEKGNRKTGTTQFAAEKQLTEVMQNTTGNLPTWLQQMVVETKDIELMNIAFGHQMNVQKGNVNTQKDADSIKFVDDLMERHKDYIMEAAGVGISSDKWQAYKDKKIDALSPWAISIVIQLPQEAKERFLLEQVVGVRNNDSAAVEKFKADALDAMERGKKDTEENYSKMYWNTNMIRGIYGMPAEMVWLLVAMTPQHQKEFITKRINTAIALKSGYEGIEHDSGFNEKAAARIAELVRAHAKELPEDGQEKLAKGISMNAVGDMAELIANAPESALNGLLDQMWSNISNGDSPYSDKKVQSTYNQLVSFARENKDSIIRPSPNCKPVITIEIDEKVWDEYRVSIPSIAYMELGPLFAQLPDSYQQSVILGILAQHWFPDYADDNIDTTKAKMDADALIDANKQFLQGKIREIEYIDLKKSVAIKIEAWIVGLLRKLSPEKQKQAIVGIVLAIKGKNADAGFKAQYIEMVNKHGAEVIARHGLGINQNEWEPFRERVIDIIDPDKYVKASKLSSQEDSEKIKSELYNDAVEEALQKQGKIKMTSRMAQEYADWLKREIVKDIKDKEVMAVWPEKTPAEREGWSIEVVKLLTTETLEQVYTATSEAKLKFFGECRKNEERRKRERQETFTGKKIKLYTRIPDKKPVPTKENKNKA